MVQNTGSYKPSQLIVVLSHPTLKATHVVTGFMQDSIVSIERDNATWEHFVGADGFTSRTHNIDKSAKATLSLQNASYSNDVLQQFLNFDENGTGAEGFFSITIADKSGRSITHSNQAYVAKQPNQDFTNATTAREWEIQMTHTETKIGGNSLIPQDVLDTLALFNVEIDSQWYTQ